MKQVSQRSSFPRSRATIPVSSHGIRKAGLSRGAIETVETLQRAGFSAELVGGCVRDLLIGIQPYDFDIATSARPEQVRELFRRCRIIGRRFRLAHVQIGREIIEVSTYRARPAKGSFRSERSRVSAKGRILRDNVYGDIEQDAFRRDLTINALYLRLPDMSIVDYAGGYDDIDSKLIRVIGKPAHRFQEDPVRMLRSLRFAAALNFALDRSASDAMPPLAHMLTEVPNARLADEISKMFYCGNSADAFDLLGEHHLLSRIFPSYARLMSASRRDDTMAYVRRIFSDTDLRIGQGVHVSMPYTISALLWLPYRLSASKALESGTNRGARLNRHLQSLSNRLISQQSERMFIGADQQDQIKQIWLMQRELDAEIKESLVSRANFRAAVRLFELRTAIGDADPHLCEKWVDLRDQHEPSSRRPGRRQRNRSRRKRR